MLKVCATCNKEFDTDWPTKVCCSAECSLLRKKETDHLWRKAHPEKLYAASRKHYKAHPEEEHEWQRKWRKTPRGKASGAAVRHNRRTRLSGISMTIDMVLELKADFDGFCPYCWDKIISGHVDHIVPVSRGGTNQRNNLAWVCAECNAQKGDKSLVEFRLVQEAEAKRA